MDHVVKRFIIRFNTAVSLQANSFAIHVDEDWGLQDYTLRVEGNIAINTESDSRIVRMPTNVSEHRNYYATTLENFAGSTPPYDFHITDQHGARAYATGLVDYPALDIDSQRRDPDRLDAGADQYDSTVNAGPG